MKRPLVVGVDLGSQSTKAALFRVDGQCLAEASAEVPLHRPGPGHVEQDPEDFYRSATATISTCVTASGCEPADVAVIGLSGQMAGILGVDARGHAVTPYDSWLDARCLAEVAEMAERLGQRLVELTGCPPMVAHAPKMLWWCRQRPDVYARVKKFLVPSAFVAGMLCDLPADESFVDWTYLHFSGLADAGRVSWSPELGPAVGLDIERLPRIVAPTDRVGALSQSAAADCGLRPGTPVAAGLGDTAAGALGAGVVQAGQLLDTAGTASVLAVSASRFAPDPSGTLVLMRGAVRGQWLSLSYLAGGDLLAWLPRVLGAPGLEPLVEEAAGARSSGLFFVPHLGGRVLPAAPAARGGWVGLDLTQGRGDLTRAVLESVAFEYAGFLDKALELYPELAPRDVRVIGGGSDDQLWNQLKASALGLPYVRMRPRSFSCWGAALVAAAAVGEVDDLGSAALQASELSDRTEPDPQLQALYSRRRRDYQALVDLLLSSVQKVPA
jgi:xylulokinase